MSVKYGKPRFRTDRDKWELPVYQDGKRKRLLFQTRKEAADFLAGPIDAPESITIRDATVSYFEIRSRKKTSAANEKRYFNLMYHFLTEEQRLSHLAQVKYSHMVAFQNWLKVEREYEGEILKWSNATVNRAFNSIKDFFIHWVREGEIPSTPCAHLRHLPAEDNSRRPMTAEEFIKALEQSPDWVKPPMVFMHLTAAAPSSIARFKREHIYFENGFLKLYRKKGKIGMWREVLIPLTTELAALLKAQPVHDHGFVFSNENGTPLSAEWFSRVGNRAIKAAGLTDVVLYCVRHALASELTDKNVSTEVVRRLMGHANIRTTQGYMKPKMETLRDSLTIVRGGKCHQTATNQDVGSEVGGSRLAAGDGN